MRLRLISQHLRRHHRTGFTIVELLVSMALIIFIMTILSEAFVASVTAFSQLKAVGDLQEKLRSTSMMLRRDLQADHFYPPTKARLSQWDYTQSTTTAPDGVTTYGFFRIWQGSDTDTDASGFAVAEQSEGVDDVTNGDGTGIPSLRAANHLLHFTVKMQGIRPEGYFTGRIPTTNTALQGLSPAPYQNTGVYLNQWAEVTYFLRPTYELAGSTPLYALYRRFRVCVPAAGKGQSVNTTPTPYYSTFQSDYYEVSVIQDPANPTTNLYFNGPDDLTVPERRMFANETKGSGLAGLPPGYAGTLQTTPWYPCLADAQVVAPAYTGQAGGLGSSALQAGDDLVLQDVLSFDVRALYDTPGTGGTVVMGNEFQPFPACTNNTAYNGSIKGMSPIRLFDTWSSATAPTDPVYDYSGWASTTPSATTIPLKARVRALQIIIRVWDKKTRQARQITLVQDM